VGRCPHIACHAHYDVVAVAQDVNPERSIRADSTRLLSKAAIVGFPDVDTLLNRVGDLVR
jgi:hypothetical protein